MKKKGRRGEREKGRVGDSLLLPFSHSPFLPLPHSPAPPLFLSCIDFAFRVPFRQVSRLILHMCKVALEKGQRPKRTFQLSQYCNSDKCICGSAISGPAGRADRL